MKHVLVSLSNLISLGVCQFFRLHFQVQVNNVIKQTQNGLAIQICTVS